MGLESLACMEQWLREQKGKGAEIAADMIPTAVDGYLREQDMANLRCSDLSWNADCTQVGAHFGRAMRGESSKTGREQGGVFEDPHGVAILRRRTAKLKENDKVFPLSPAHSTGGGGRPRLEGLLVMRRRQGHHIQPGTLAPAGTWPQATAPSTR